MPKLTYTIRLVQSNNFLFAFQNNFLRFVIICWSEKSSSQILEKIQIKIYHQNKFFYIITSSGKLTMQMNFYNWL